MCTRMLNSATSGCGHDGKVLDCRVGVLPDAPVEANDLVPGLVLPDPQIGPSRGLVVPAGQRFRKRAVEDLTEVPGFPGRRVFDQAEKVRSGRSQGPADVVFGEPVELPDQHLPCPLQVAVEVLLREVIDHRPQRVSSATAKVNGTKPPGMWNERGGMESHHRRRRWRIQTAWQLHWTDGLGL
jgi:hypothetical protein